jgi:hypothetical protein
MSGDLAERSLRLSDERIRGYDVVGPGPTGDGDSSYIEFTATRREGTPPPPNRMLESGRDSWSNRSAEKTY